MLPLQGYFDFLTHQIQMVISCLFLKVQCLKHHHYMSGFIPLTVQVHNPSIVASQPREIKDIKQPHPAFPPNSQGQLAGLCVKTFLRTIYFLHI